MQCHICFQKILRVWKDKSLIWNKTKFETNWHRLVSDEFPITYLCTLLLKYSKINVVKMKQIDNFLSNCFRCRAQPFIWKLMMIFLKDTHFEKLQISGGTCPQGRKCGPLLKQKIFNDWIFLLQCKILNFSMIGFHPISLSTFIRNFSLYCSVKKCEKCD